MKDGKLIVKDGKINFFCNMFTCKHCCCGPFGGISEELASVDKRPFDEIVLTDEDYEKLFNNGYAYLIEDGYSDGMKKPYHKMALKEDGTCKAYKDGMCSIHDISPTLCKAFPFYFDMFSGLCAIQCDGFRKNEFTPIDNLKPYFENARKMYEFWLKFYTE